jgi:hypothetical protein
VRIAANLPLPVSGTSDVLAAAARDWLDVGRSVQRVLAETNFLIAEAFLNGVRSLIRTLKGEGTP